MFSEQPAELTPELEAARDSLREELGRLAGGKEIDLRWELVYGRRDTGGTGGVPNLSQWGFQVSGWDRETGERRPLHCFLEESVAIEERSLATRILDLWTDRVETGGIVEGE